MATDYSKKTNAELIEILKSRNLPHTGKKAEMVARLQENDNSAAKTEDKPATDDVIDWEDDEVPAGEAAAKASTATGAAAIAAGGQGEVENPVKVPNQKLDEEADPATAKDLKVEQPGAGAGDAAQQQEEGKKEEEGAAATEKVEEEEKKPAVTYSAGLPITEMEEELKKRKARAEKFGVTEESKAAIEAAEKQLERAKRFGTAAPAPGEVGVKKLDEALPEKEEKSRKRGRGDDQSGGRGGKKRDVGGRNRFRGRGGHGGNRNQGQGGRPQRQQNGGGAPAATGPKTTNWSDKDVQALEARKKRFGTAA
ncbi:hypothetical protein AbraIFM66951_005713 [Aspergillus brasiliensis]|uniref:SAP domain-containing protein n=1 Tax=Aspergillus brasiliensis TaxID=319629 RepID=A0A9W6DIX5_9EURO|nr:hypothetical protein AbraCBS73388_005972 [Aspergillus brasiliensis]GKZ43997.1 hypothetical protein AbraIFM66951_005713 [Aspergillus brasiliensis]